MVQITWYVDFGILLKIPSRLLLGVGVDPAPGQHKPQKWTFQTRSFSEHQKILESVQYEKSYGSLKLRKKKSKKNKNDTQLGFNSDLDSGVHVSA